MSSKKTQIKICGLTTPEDIRYINETRPDFAGFVLFFEKSKRNLSPQQAKILTELLSEQIKKVAVVVAPTLEQIREIEKTGFDYIQIHGALPESILSEIRLPVLKAFNVRDMKDISFYQAHPKIKGYVFDALEPGSGRTFDWKTVSELPVDHKLFFLAGGLCAENVTDAINAVHPDAVDVSSGVEYDAKPGKDPEKIRAFVANVRKL